MSASAGYAFLPWLRTGLAAGLGDPPAGPRVAVPVTVTVDAAGDRRDVTAPVALYGPGEVAGIDPRLVLRTFPKAGETDAEPSNLPLVELAPADFPWRYTPAGPDGNGRLRPWLVLVVLADGEFGDESPAGPDGRPPSLTVTTAASLPRL